MIGDNVDQDSRALKVMLPTFEGFKNCKELFVMNIIVVFWFMKHASKLGTKPNTLTR